MSPRARRLIALVTLVLAVALIAVLTLQAFGVPIAIGPFASATPLPAPSATLEPSGGPSTSLEDLLAAIEADVADLRDLPPVDMGPVEFVTRDKLQRRLADHFVADYTADEIAADNALFRALGLLTAEQDVGALQLQLLAGQVLGYYDDVTQSMVIVTEAGLTPEAQVTYAHEYTHALQDAAFGIDSMALDAQGDDDGAFARLALVEGDATTVMVLWAIDHLRAEDLLEISQTPLPDTTGVPDWMLRQLEFPYLAGTDFVAQLYARGGFAAVDEAWADPPVSSEQVLHFRAYVDDELPVVVPEMDPDVRALGVETVEDTTLGEAMIAIWLAHLGLDQADADTAAAGWGGDRVTALVTPDGDVAQLYALGGFAAVDEAWADPPVSSEQVLHFRAYVDDELPVVMPEMDPDVRALGVDIVEDTTLGEAMIAIWLAHFGLDQADADTAAAGWGGDRVTALVTPDGEVAVVLRLAWDTKVDADEFEAAYADALETLQLFGHLDRVSDTEVVVTQASTRALAETLVGGPL